MTIDDLKKNGITNDKKVFEYLSRNNNEFFFIPENLAELVADIVQNSNPNSCINLNSNFGEILSKCTKIENRIGIDISSQNVELSNYLNPNLRFENTDPLEYNSEIGFDSVICFPPLGQRVKVNGKNIQSEQLYVSKTLELLSENGKAVFIVPSNFLTTQLYESVLNFILNKFSLEFVISLPKGILRNTGVELSVLVINTKDCSKTNYLKINDKNFKKFELDSIIEDFSIEQDNLSERRDYNFHNPTNIKYDRELKIQETKNIDELVEVVLGTHFSKDEIESTGHFLWMTSQNISNGELQFTENDKYITRNELSRQEQKGVLENGDILITRTIRRKESPYVHTNTQQRIIASQHFIILRGKNAEYVATYLNTDNGINLFNNQIFRHAKGTVIPTISISDLKNIEIPILPIEHLDLASKRTLEKLPNKKLLILENDLKLLQIKYNKLKEQNTTPAQQQLNGIQATLSEVLKGQKSNTGKIDSMTGKVDSMTGKLDEIKSTLTELSSDFKCIKDLPRDIDEKLHRLNEKLDIRFKDLITDKKQLDFYISEIKRWFDFYDLLEPNSQKYLPEANYIFDHIGKLENPDYSPFILQYCRAFENELLNKIFRSYVQSLIDRKISIESEFAWDLVRKENGKPNDPNTFKLAKHLQKCLKKPEEEWFFEFGVMEVNLRYLTGKTVKKSPLLMDFKGFVLTRFEQEILNIDYLDEIKIIIRDYRNQSAHPNLMDTEKAVKFHKKMKECLISLMENYKQ